MTDFIFLQQGDIVCARRLTDTAQKHDPVIEKSSATYIHPLWIVMSIDIKISASENCNVALRLPI